MRRPIALAGVLTLAVVFWLHADAWTFVCDDAYISFRYARHLAEHGVLEFNLGERVEGYTNFLWVLLLAGGQLLTIAPETLSPVLTVLSSATGLGLAVALCRTLRGSFRAFDLRDLLPAALLVLCPSYMVWAHSGLETSLAATLILAAILAWMQTRLVLAALLAGAALLTRPDTAVPIASFGVTWAIEQFIVHTQSSALRSHVHDLPWRRVFIALAVFSAIVGGHFVWRYIYYGHWLPNTWAIKSHGHLLRDTHGWPYLTTWVRETGLVYALALVPMLRLRHLKLVAPIAATAAYVWSVGGDFMAYSRLLLPATTLGACLVAWLLADLGAALATRVHGFRQPHQSLRLEATSEEGHGLPAVHRRGQKIVYAFYLASGLTVALMLGALARRATATWAHDRATPSGWLDGRYEGVTAMARFAAVRVEVGSWMAKHLPPATRVSVGAAGALPYASDLPTIDAYGLVDPTFTELDLQPQTGPRARPGHQLHAPHQHILAQNPDLLCHIGIVHTRRPGALDARRRAGPGYAWACISPGPAHLPDGAFEFGNYCCLRKRDNTVGPFGP